MPSRDSADICHFYCFASSRREVSLILTPVPIHRSCSFGTYLFSSVKHYSKGGGGLRDNNLRKIHARTGGPSFQYIYPLTENSVCMMVVVVVAVVSPAGRDLWLCVLVFIPLGSSVKCLSFLSCFVFASHLFLPGSTHSLCK